MLRIAALCPWIVAALLVVTGPVRAQGIAKKPGATKPRPAKKASPAPARRVEPGELDEDEDKDLMVRNIVRSATKTKTTVAEAPGVVHIVTAKDISRLGYRNLIDALLIVPGFLDSNAQFDQIPGWMTFGIMQSVLYLRDGISMFDPLHNAPATRRRIPMETIKRIEAMTTPGGVLWGANSFLGIVNVMTKDPEDVNGVEFGLGGGHGAGDEQVVRPYLLYGQTFFKGKLGVLLHWSIEWFKGPRYNIPELWVASSPAGLSGPSSFRFPNGVDTSVDTSLYSQVDGKIRYSWSGNRHQITLAGQFVFTRLPDLHRTIKEGKAVWLWDGLHRPIGFWGVPMNKLTPNQLIRHNRLNWHDSYAYLHYRGRWLDNKLGMEAKGYYVQFQRVMDPYVQLGYSNELVPGVGNTIDAVGHRSGVTLDMSAQLHHTFRLLWGGELFYEWVKDAMSEFIAPIDSTGQLNFSLLRSTGCTYYNRNGDMIPVYDPDNPNNTTYLPGCRQPFVFDANRLVYAGYLSALYKPHKTLSLSAGLRVQHSPAGNVPYDVRLLYSGAAVWNFYKGLFMKVNFSTGFRPPIFNATSANAAGGNYGGDPNLNPEESRAVKTAFIARLVQNRKRIRQWVLRVNYSYTELFGIIRMIGGQYFNSSKRAIHAGELNTDLHIKGGHRLVLSYTYVRQHGDSSKDGGIFRSVPNHWLAGGAVFRMLNFKNWKLDLNVTFRIVGPFEDPNQLMICPQGSDYCTTRVSDRTWDRIHPAGILNAGLRLIGRPGGRLLEISANFYNMLDGVNWTPDPFNDISADVEKIPGPTQRFYFFLQAKFRI